MMRTVPLKKRNNGTFETWDISLTKSSFHLIPLMFRREIIREPYPRREPDTISGRDIIYLVNRMLAMDWSIDQLRDYFYSHLRQPLPTN